MSGKNNRTLPKKETPPKFCPVCGRDSIRVYEREGVLDLYRCGQSHYFHFLALQSETQEKK